MDNLSVLHSLGFTGEDVCLAHCVWLSEDEKIILQQTGTHVLHCPSSNLKLASGIASVQELIEMGIHVSLGADGAPKLATRGGAAALGLADQIGSLETGKLADVIVVDVSGAHCVPSSDPYSTVVFAARSSDVRHVVVNGKTVVRDKEILTIDRSHCLTSAQASANKLFARL
jgi:5-methylthioadenosine/S-adenosylhomocysteine deaminase